MTQANVLAASGSQGVSQGFKNRIINGAMVISQRNAGASVTPANNAYTLDRWRSGLSQSSKYTVQQNAGSVTLPLGFTNYLGVTSSSAYTVGTSEYFFQMQRIEGYNIADLGWGTANAKSVSLSFLVYSSLTGTFGGAIQNDAADRSYPFIYTISSANTWTQISIVIAGPTSGTWLTTNGQGLQITFGLGVGSTYSGTAGSWSATNYFSATGATSVVGTSGATFYITGVQLEVGSSATGFEYVNYQTSLANCQRYFQRFQSTNTDSTLGLGMTPTTTRAVVYIPWKVTMRTSPTAVSSSLKITDWQATSQAVSSPSAVYSSDSGASIDFTVSGFTAYRPCYLFTNTSAGYFDVSAEL